MISVAEAKHLLLANTPPPQPVQLSLAEAGGYVLAEALYSPIDMPPFAQSAMDGYALNFGQLEADAVLRVRHSVQAGAAELPRLAAGEAIRIFTGAPVPPGADTVVMQEKVELVEGGIRLLDPELKAGANVRSPASQTQKGALAAPAGTRLNPGSIGFLAGLGLSEASVFAAPATGLLITGKELVAPGTPLQMGQVYESNSASLRAVLAEGGITPVLLRQVEDEAEATYAAIQEGLAGCRLLLITGGISVGDYDFVYAALQQAGVETLFYKVKQRPGKPLYCGRKGDTLVFGLPGNPASVLSCFYQYVVPAIRQMKGLAAEATPPFFKTLREDFTKSGDLPSF
ncbi:molybdopterin molybdotransferase MoeA [Cesiribacter andamanensis]|uniref:Molybdopterin molybdenumtransferase n=1 Tax=Cesiribacter andamanensis AMV16 TaxID=1279009 RepID=M7NZ88_9BACT|nr:molybdopterin molybdotransferase MoeA [Cesiribacter andamanensis]EMR03669.1 Molybdopterin molybdenumtransferase [Cesiribacter andamanensis AMV16]